jgi:hypothetical protein
MEDYQDYPKWIEVDGDGSSDYPGHVLVNDADEEAEHSPKKGKKANA